MLCELARCGASSLLASVLRVDHDSAIGGWTVACYEIGDTAPSALHEHDDPVAALAALVNCDTPSHIASELICNGEDGLQWVALTRSRTQVRFHLPDELNTSAHRSALVNVAIRGWSEQLERHRHDRPAVRPEPLQIRAERAAGHSVDRASAPSSGDEDPAVARAWADEFGEDFGDERFSQVALEALGFGADDSAASAPLAPTSVSNPVGVVTARHLNSAVRTALAGAVPYLEQYFLDALAERIAAKATAEDEEPDAGAPAIGSGGDVLDAVLRGQQELAAELRSVQRQHLSEVIDLNVRIRRLEARLADVRAIAGDVAPGPASSRCRAPQVSDGTAGSSS